MHYVAGGLFTAACYRWPLIGLAVIILLLGYFCSQIPAEPVDSYSFVKDWSPTIVKDVHLNQPVFNEPNPARGKVAAAINSMTQNRKSTLRNGLGVV